MHIVIKPKEKKSILSDQDLKSITNWISKMKKMRTNSLIYVDKALDLDYEGLGSGKTRIVYALNKKYVLKVAINKRGLKSNKTEHEIYQLSSSRLKRHLCPVIDYGDGWLIMERMQRVVSLTDEIENKLPRLRRKFKKEGIVTRSLRSKNLSISNHKNRIVVIDYGSFRY